jgi:lysophospholipase L1-like esterase
MLDEQIEGNIASMAELAQAHRIRVVLASIMPTSAYHAAPNAEPQTSRRPLARILAINDWIRRYATDHRHVYLDYFAAMVDEGGMLREDLSADDLHPNAKGYAIMGPLAEAAIRKALQ